MPEKIQRDRSKNVFFRCAEPTYEAIRRYAGQHEMTMASAIITLVRDGIERYETRRQRRSAAA